MLWVKFCLPPNLHVDTAKSRVINNLKRGSKWQWGHLGPYPRTTGALREGADTWTRPGVQGGWAVCRLRGGSWSRVQPGLRRSRFCWYPDAKPASSRLPSMVLCYSSPGEHTHTACHASCKPGGETGRCFHTCLQFHKKRTSVVTWWAGRNEAEGEAGVRLLNTVSLSSFDLWIVLVQIFSIKN